MKLLLDQNISTRLTTLLKEIYPEITHVRERNLQTADDVTLWNFARDHGFVIVTKDADFHQRSFLFGQPPKIIWLRTGNSSTKDLEGLLRRSQEKITLFLGDHEASFLCLSL